MKSTVYFLMFFTILSVVSCDLFNTDDDMNQGDCKIVKSSFDIPNDPARGETTYRYNDDGHLSSIESSDWDYGSLPYKMRTQIDYSGDNVSRIRTYTTFENNPEEKQFEYDFYYESDVLDSVYYEGFNAFLNVKGYILTRFVGDELSEVQRFYYTPSQSQYNLGEVSNLTWSGGNVTEVNTIQPIARDTLQYKYEYDAMHSSLRHTGLSLTSNEYYLLSSNNIIKSEYYINGNPNRTDDYTYTYNSNDYPLTSQQLGGYPLYNHDYDCN